MKSLENFNKNGITALNFIKTAMQLRPRKSQRNEDSPVSTSCAAVASSDYQP